MLFYNVEVVNVIPRVKGTIRGKEKKITAIVQRRKEKKKEMRLLFNETFTPLAL